VTRDALSAPFRHLSLLRSRHAFGVNEKETRPLVADLQQALAPDRVRASQLELDLYARDASIISGRAEVVCFPLTASEVQACVRVCRKHGRPFVPRGSGTGLAGGAVPVGDPVVIVTTKMTRILEVDADERVAWVEPGVLNLDLSRAVAHLGLHYAPDPSSQQSCSIGGNVATNSGGHTACCTASRAPTCWP